MVQTELELQAEGFISRFLRANDKDRANMKAEGAELASRLRDEAIGLAQSRATEFSPKIGTYHQLAAKVALLAHWPDSKALKVFEDDIRYYRSFESTVPLVDDYERFREAYTKGRVKP